jgi:hypothetical protein
MLNNFTDPTEWLAKSDRPYYVIFVSQSLGVGLDWVHLVRRPLIGLLFQLQTIDDACGAVDGMRIGRGNRSTRRKPAPVPLCPPQILHDLTWAQIRAAAVGSRRLTAWAMAQSFVAHNLKLCTFAVFVTGNLQNIIIYICCTAAFIVYFHIKLRMPLAVVR